VSSDCPETRRAIYQALKRDWVNCRGDVTAFRVVALYRIGHWLHLYAPIRWYARPLLVVARVLRRLTIFFPHLIELPFTCHIGPGLRIVHVQNIVLSGGTRIGADCTMFHGVTIGVSELGPDPFDAAVLGDRVFLGAGAAVIGKVVIGDDVVLGAGALVTRDVPSGATVIGTNELLDRD
jgi:serine O-acetyltransferase